MLIEIANMPLVDMEFMNKTHQEDIEIINELYKNILEYEQEPSAQNKEKLEVLYNEWFEHTIEHFRVEEQKMIEKSFPPYLMHKAEHDNALRVMDETFRMWQVQESITPLKEYFEGPLAPWLIHHINTMDTVTARFFNSGISPCSIH